MRLIIADVKSHSIKGKCVGHYFSVARNYLELFRDECDVKVAGGPIYEKAFLKEELFSLPYTVIEEDNALKNKWKVLQNCRYLFKNTSDNDVLVMQQSGTSTMFMFLALFAKKKSNIYFIEYGTDSIMGIFKKFIYGIAKRKLKGLVCPNSLIGKTFGLPYCVVTDYIYTGKRKVEDNLSYEDKPYDFSIVGSIWPDKGVVEAVERLASTNYKVIIAGNPVLPELKVQLEKIAAKSPSVELKLGYISDAEYYSYIRNSRYCILNYHGCYSERSSGVVLDTLFNGVPIVGHRCKALQFVEDEDVGYLFNDVMEFNPENVIVEKKYNRYINHLKRYLKKQILYKRKLFDFICLK